jgi:hypothetical protein
VCVGASDSTTLSDDPFSSALCVMCVGHFPRGGQVCPPSYAQCSTPGIMPRSTGFGGVPHFFCLDDF